MESFYFFLGKVFFFRGGFRVVVVIFGFCFGLDLGYLDDLG